MQAQAHILNRYQITLPSSLREALGAKVGDLLVFVRQQDGHWKIESVPRTLSKTLAKISRHFPAKDFL